jgi:hypothetical protein
VNHAIRGSSKLGAILGSLFLVAMLLPGAALAATLTFTTPPAGATGGVPFPTQPKVTISLPDATSGTVSLAIGTNPSAGTLSGCAPSILDSTTGTFTFSGCRIDKAGTGYTLVATWSTDGAVTATSAPFNVAVGEATRLAFTQATIASAAVGANLVPQPVVTIQDAGGNTVTSSTANVALAITSGTPTVGGPGALSCTDVSVKAIAGVATFAACKINANSGVGYRLRATSGSLTAVDSNAFDITSDTATKLAFSAQPGGGTGGTVWTTQPAVQVQDASGNLVVTDNTTVVTLAIGTNPGTGTLTCTGGLAKTVVNGQATFAGCTINRVGTGYRLVATSSPVRTSATSNAFNVTLGAAAKLGFTAQPTAATTKVSFPIQPVVAIQDLGGNTVSSTATVTLAIGTNPGGGTLTCTNGLTRSAVAGVATFSGCQINNAGAGYTLTANATGLTAATSTAFTVGAPAASITLTTSAPIGAGGLPTITWGGGIILTTQFGTNGGNRTFKLQATRDNITWFDIGPLLTTNGSGRNQFAFRPSTNFFYRAVFGGAPDLAAGTSASVRTVVRQIALLRPTNGGAVRSIGRNTSITFFTVVRPSRPELTPARVTFSFFRLSGSTWVLSTQRTVTAASDGRAATTFKFSTSGQWYARSMANPTPYNANSVMSTIERYSVN